ncbi:acyltransferase family protein [Janibacter hoylei]|nr:acyltransferase family protein [Janibacter hoylei]MCW4600559.1 acyltransferase family protein [Janibacter hoylei]
MDGAKARPGRILGLDALRAVAAWLVLLSHVAFWTGAGAEGIIGGLAVRGELGVAIFFALSAYLLSTPFVRRALGGHVVWSLPATSCGGRRGSCPGTCWPWPSSSRWPPCSAAPQRVRWTCPPSSCTSSSARA